MYPRSSLFAVLMTGVALLFALVAKTASAGNYVVPQATVTILAKANVPWGNAVYLAWPFGQFLPASRSVFVAVPLVLGTQVGNTTQCVAFVQAVSGAPATGSWQRGRQAMTNALPVGTAIALFQGNGLYSQAGAGHCAILLNKNAAGILVADQNWVPPYPSMVKVHFIPRTGSGTVGDAAAYYEISN